MFEDEKCPYCGSKDYGVDDYDIDLIDEIGHRFWYCSCSRCKGTFTIIDTYQLKDEYIELNQAPTEPYQISMFDHMEG